MRAIKILVVDDSETVRKAICTLLRQEGFEMVEEAEHGKEAVKMALELKPDVVLMDIKMPLLDGFEATRTIKEKLPQTKVIGLTVYEEKEVLEKAAEAGFSSFIVKGERIENITQTIRRVYQGEKTPPLSSKSREFSYFKELSEKLAALSILIETTQKLAASRRQEEAFQSVQKIASRLAGTSYCLFRNPEGKVDWQSWPFSSEFPHSKLACLPVQLVEKIQSSKHPQILDPKKMTVKKLLPATKLKGLLIFPLQTGKEFLGTFEYFYSAYTTFSPHEIESLQSLNTNLALTLEGIKLKDNLKELFYSTIKAFVQAVEAKEPYLKGHSEKVSQLATEIGKRMGLNSEELEWLSIAGLLHDIGKIGVDDRVLKKPGSLNTKERKEIEKHPVIGMKIIKPVALLSPTIKAIYHHHERWDGKGYPSRLKGEKIPFFARILNVADAYEAMTSWRIYRSPLSLEEAKEELKSQSSLQFDSEVVKVFLQTLK